MPSVDAIVVCSSNSASSWCVWATMPGCAGRTRMAPLRVPLLPQIVGQSCRRPGVEPPPGKIPLTPPPALMRAFIFPRRMTFAIAPRMWPVAMSSAALKKQCMSGGLSSKGLRCSAVILEQPAAAPRRENLKLAANFSSSNWNDLSGTFPAISRGNGSWVIAGLALSCRTVSIVPGAKSAPSKACLPDDNSIWTRCRARSAR